VLIAGTLPGVIAGSVIRVELLPSAHPFDFVVASGAWLTLTRPSRTDDQARPARVIPLPVFVLLAAGGLAGAYTGARLQRRLPDVLIRRVMGVPVVVIGARYLWSGLS
jgi:uncharacterized protein